MIGTCVLIFHIHKGHCDVGVFVFV